MSFQKRIIEVQTILNKENMDGWLLYDFRRSNDLACEFLQIPHDTFLTRRFFYWIPKKGDPVKIVHQVEDHTLNHLPGDVHKYSTWQQLDAHLGNILNGAQRVAMEYSPRNAIPYVSKVDAGTIDLIREFQIEVVSSADLLQRYTSVLSDQQAESHRDAAEFLSVTVDKAWEYISNCLKQDKEINEYDVQQFILSEFDENGYVTDGAPIIGVNAHAADPHYEPTAKSSSSIRKNDFILIDLWCRKGGDSTAIYGDICRVGVAANQPTEYQQKIFNIVKEARDAATELVKERFSRDEPIMGWEIDQKCRDIIAAAGFEEYFIHRTGHNIGTKDHGNGAHIDNFETQDRRQILPGTCFSIEPGIYLPGEFGVRLEYDVLIHLNGLVEVTGGIQDKITTLL